MSTTVASSNSPSQVSTHLQEKPYIEISHNEFFQKFGWGNAKMLATDENTISDKKSISSFDVGDCITVFAIEKNGNTNAAIIGWHISNGSTVEDLEEEFDEYAEQEKKYEIYIVGGISLTTEGEECLLDNIYDAIDNFFSEETVVVKELVNLCEVKRTNFISVNLQLNGTLTICYHNT